MTCWESVTVLTVSSSPSVWLVSLEFAWLSVATFVIIVR